MTVELVWYVMLFGFFLGAAFTAGAILVIAGAIEAHDWFKSRP